MFCSDDPRGVANYLWLWWFSFFDALPVAPALTVPFLLAPRRRPVSLLRLPPRPLPSLLPALRAAIPLPRLPRMKTLLAAFEETPAHPRPVRRTLPPASRLIFGMACRTLGRAHGRSRPPEALAPDWN